MPAGYYYCYYYYYFVIIIIIIIILKKYGAIVSVVLALTPLVCGEEREELWWRQTAAAAELQRQFQMLRSKISRRIRAGNIEATNGDFESIVASQINNAFINLPDFAHVTFTTRELTGHI